MAVTTKKSLLFLAGGVAAAAIVAYAAGAFDPLLKREGQTIASLPQAEPAETGQPAQPQEPGAAAPEAVAPAEPEADTATTAEAEDDAAEETSAPATEAASASAPAEVVPPSFDLLRVEGDGSIVIAGKAAQGAAVDLLIGSNVIGSGKAGAEGDFAVVLDEPLKPGDYQIVLRATAPDNIVAMSMETAVVSVPSQPDGQVLALVEEPGKPSQMITVPAPQQPAAVIPHEETASAPQTAAAPEQSVSTQTPAPEMQSEAAAPPQAPAPETAAPEAAAEPQTQAAAPEPEPVQQAPAAGKTVRVEAVEIDGRSVFVAGAAEAGRTVRGYANEILLGDAMASPEGRFLIETERDLPVGDYIIRVDVLEDDGVKVAARAAVPFEREPGESIAAIAPPPPAPPPSAPVTPAPVTSAPAEPMVEPAVSAPVAQAQPESEPEQDAASSPAAVTQPGAQGEGLGQAEAPPVQTAGEAVALAPEPSSSEPQLPEPQLPESRSPEQQSPEQQASTAPQVPEAQPAREQHGATPDAAVDAPQSPDGSVGAGVGETPALQAPAGQTPSVAHAPDTHAPDTRAPDTHAPDSQPAQETPAVAGEEPADAVDGADGAVAGASAEHQPAGTGMAASDAAPASSGEPPAASVPAPVVAEAAPLQTGDEAARESQPAAGEQQAADAAPAAPVTGQRDAPAQPHESAATQSPADGDEVEAVLAPKLQPVGSAVIIRRGDTLWRISRRVYGRGVRYSTIYLANQNQIEDPNRIWPGQVFQVPETSNDGKAEADYSRLGDRLTDAPADGEAQPENPVQE